MPVFPIFENVTFDPVLTKLMGDAFDRAMVLLSIVPAKIVQEAMANRIIEATHKGAMWIGYGTRRLWAWM